MPITAVSREYFFFIFHSLRSFIAAAPPTTTATEKILLNPFNSKKVFSHFRKVSISEKILHFLIHKSIRQQYDVKRKAGEKLTLLSEC